MEASPSTKPTGGEAEVDRRSRDLSIEVWRWGRLGAIALLALIAVLLLLDRIDPEVAAAVFGVLLAAAVIAVLTPDLVRALLDRTQKVSLGPFAMELVADAARAAARSDTSEEGSLEGASLTDLQLTIEHKLAYVAKHLLPGPDGPPTFVTIGSLRFDRYLTESEALTAMRLLTINDEMLAALPERPRQEFLRDAGTLAKNLRASVFAGMVRKAIRDSAAVELAGEVDVGPRRRPDLLVSCAGKYLRVAIAFAPYGENQDSVGQKRQRIAGSDNADDTSLRLVVIPDSSHVAEERQGNPGVVRLENLLPTITARAGDNA
jgi:hypothetical protein